MILRETYWKDEKNNTIARQHFLKMLARTYFVYISASTLKSADFGHRSRIGGITFSPLEVLGIDTKLDDGQPGTGYIRGVPSTSTVNPGCTTTADPTTSIYNVSNAGIACTFLRIK